MNRTQARKYLLKVARQIVKGEPLDIGAIQLKEIADMLRETEHDEEAKMDQGGGKEPRVRAMERS